MDVWSQGAGPPTLCKGPPKTDHVGHGAVCLSWSTGCRGSISHLYPDLDLRICFPFHQHVFVNGVLQLPATRRYLCHLHDLLWTCFLHGQRNFVAINSLHWGTPTGLTHTCWSQLAAARSSQWLMWPIDPASHRWWMQVYVCQNSLPHLVLIFCQRISNNNNNNSNSMMDW